MPSCSRGRPAHGSTPSSSGCTHYPLLGAVIRGIVGEGMAVIDSATATASALASLLEIHGLGGTTDGREARTTAHDRGRGGLPGDRGPSLRSGSGSLSPLDLETATQRPRAAVAIASSRRVHEPPA